MHFKKPTLSTIRWAFFLGSDTPESDYGLGTKRIAFECSPLTRVGDIGVLVVPRRGVVAVLEVTSRRAANCCVRVTSLPLSPISRADALSDDILKIWNVARRNMVAPTRILPELEQIVARRLEALLAERGAGVPSSSQGKALDASDNSWEPTSAKDARTRELRSIALRKGQPAFRRALLSAYEGRCAITGCDAEEALEAAHIVPYNGSSTNHVQNGLLLRADIHTLFDLGVIHIDPEHLTVQLSAGLMSTVYREFHGKKLRLPSSRAQQPSADAFRRRVTQADLLLLT